MTVFARGTRQCFVLIALAAAVAGCGTGHYPNFGGLVAERRDLAVHSKVRLAQLDNGLQVVLAPDHRTNLVSVDVRYHVGAAQDPPGRAGLAHLVEHLMFTIAGGSDGATLADKLDAIALGFNAYTDHDVTHYTSTALGNRIDALLELEGRRMEAPCERIPAALFARERDVVLAEDGQRHTGWTDVDQEIDRVVWGDGHPYARPVGSAEVAGATQAEACRFVASYYAPSRAVLVVTGDFNPDSLIERIARRFGTIDRTPGADIPPVAAPVLSGESRHQGAVEHPTVVIYLPAPPRGSPDEAVHDVIAEALAGELARLDDDASWVLSTSVGDSGDGRQRVMAIAVEVDDAARFDDVVKAVMKRGRDLFQDDDRDGHDDDEDDDDDLAIQRRIASYRAMHQTGTLLRAEGFLGRGNELADYLSYTDDRTFTVGELRAAGAITQAQLTGYARGLFVRDHAHVAEVRPSGKGSAAAHAAASRGARTYDLEPWRAAVDPAEATRPLPLPANRPALAVDDHTMANGLRVLLYADPDSPMVDARLILPVGTIDDDAGRRGVAWLAAMMLEPEYSGGQSMQIFAKVAWATRLGTQVFGGADDSATVFRARGLANYADWHVWRLSWLLDEGAYDEDAIDHLRREMRDTDEPAVAPSERAFAARLFGAHHPYAEAPDAAAYAKVKVGDLAAWRRRWYVPVGATLIVSGGFDVATMRGQIERLFGTWLRHSPPARASAPAPEPVAGPSWIGVRRPTASQVELTIGFAAQSDGERDRAARMALAAILGDRLGMVRQRLGASYGVSARYRGVGAGALQVMTSLEADRAEEAARAVVDDLAKLHDDPSILAADFVRARRRMIGDSLALQTDAGAVATRLEWVVRHGGDLAAADQLTADLARLTLDDVAAVARRDLDPARMVVSVDGLAAPVKATLAAVGATDIAWFDEDEHGRSLPATP